MRIAALSLALVIAIVALAGAQSAPAQRSGQGITKQQADEILRELRSIHQLLDRLVQQQPGGPAAVQAPAPAPPDVKVKLANVGAFILGRPDAPLTLVEFTDLQCPFCSRFTTTTFDEIKKAYIDTGKLRFVTRDFPLGIHPEASRAARACRCAADGKRFWEMRALLGRNPGKMSRDFIISSAAELNLDRAAFTACLDSDRYQAEVTKDMTDGSEAGVGGTPTFVLGRTTGGHLEGVRFAGALPFSAFEERIKALLASSAPTSGPR